MHTASTCITLIDQLADTKIYFAEVENDCPLQKFLTPRILISPDLIQQD